MPTACKITAGPIATTGCVVVADGIVATDVWIHNKADFTYPAFTEVDSVIGAMPTPVGGAVMYKMEILKDDGDIQSQVVVSDRGARSFNHLFDATIVSIASDVRKFINEGVNGEFVVIVRTKSDEFLLGGLEADGLTFADGTNLGVNESTYGLSISMSSSKNKYVTPSILDTDVATTIAGLNALT